MRKVTIAKYKFVIIVLKATKNKLRQYMKIIDKKYLEELSGIPSEDYLGKYKL